MPGLVGVIGKNRQSDALPEMTGAMAAELCHFDYYGTTVWSDQLIGVGVVDRKPTPDFFDGDRYCLGFQGEIYELRWER